MDNDIMENKNKNNQTNRNSSELVQTLAEEQMDTKESTSNETQVVAVQGSNLLPHLESLERMMKIPVVEATWNRGQDVYGRVKGHNAMFNWAFRTAEEAVQRAVVTAAPLVQRIERPIQFVDQTLLKGIEKIEVNAPIIKEQPHEIYNQAKNKVIDVVQPHISKVCAFRAASQQKAATLKELSWQKANEVLATQFGSLAVTGVDTTSALAERLIDYYFPREEHDIEDSKPISVEEDRVLHTVQTVGRLSNKLSRRVYRTVSRQVKQLKKEDVHEYVASLIAVLQLTRYLNFINDKLTAAKAPEPITMEPIKAK